MMDELELCRRAVIKSHSLHEWIEAGWIHFRTESTDTRFSEMDLARALLIRDLLDPLGVNSEGVGIILDLLDQIHGLRRALRQMRSLTVVQESPKSQPG
jgi:chaperone modulatory protein CbpM